MSELFVKEFTAPALSMREILRYMGAKDGHEEIKALISSALNELDGRLSYRVVWREVELSCTDRSIMLGEYYTESHDLLRDLSGSDRAVIFAATVGIELDRLIMRYSRVSPSRALCFQAIGAERIEALCNTFCDELEQIYAARGLSLRPRFSPGYGDLKIEAQKYLFRSLECERKIGLTLNESLLMSPTKSVTAIIGLYKK